MHGEPIDGEVGRAANGEASWNDQPTAELNERVGLRQEHLNARRFAEAEAIGRVVRGVRPNLKFVQVIIFDVGFGRPRQRKLERKPPRKEG
jgi:hypothetical protein